MNKFRTIPFYTYTPNSVSQLNFVFVIVGITGPIMVRYFYDKYLKKYINKVNKFKNIM